MVLRDHDLLLQRCSSSEIAERIFERFSCLVLQAGGPVATDILPGKHLAKSDAHVMLLIVKNIL